jgi:glycosyltransferase involved in cell wall biosynthesis
LRKQFPYLDLAIAGSGPEEARLRNLCRELELESAVRFEGYVDRPSDWFPGAAAFVLPSRHEGLPNALLEAGAAGLPIVALPAAGGVGEMLRGLPGVWVAAEISASALAASLLKALRALAPGQRFTHEFVEPFSLERAIHGYEDMIDAIVQNHLPSRDRVLSKERRP